MPVDLNASRVLLTGATGGLGRAIAKMLHAAGAELVLTGRRADVLEALAVEVGGTFVAADLMSAAEVHRVLDAAGPVDVLIANAALPGAGYVVDYTDEEIGRVLDLNLRAPIIMACRAAREMRAAGAGQIVLIGSLSSVAASEQSAMYSATKAGLRGFALSLRQDLHGSGVGVSLVLPGFVREAGMFADVGEPLMRGTRTVPPDAVARSVRTAIMRDRAETFVAPWELRWGAVVGSVAPSLSARVQRRMGAHAVATAIAAGNQALGKR
jgi:short-subunit dehydrogenase